MNHLPNNSFPAPVRPERTARSAGISPVNDAS